MARIRTIKPEFWTDEKLSLLDPLTRLVFLGLISNSDDHGRLIDNVKYLDGTLFPHTDDSCTDPLETLAKLSRILRYTAKNGQNLIQIVAWKNHQKVDHPSRELLPAPSKEDWLQPVTGQRPIVPPKKPSRNPRETLAKSSRTISTTSTSTNDLVPMSAKAESIVPIKPAPNWVAEGSDIWKAKVGPIDPPRFGKAFRPLVTQYGWPDARDALLAYVEINEGRARRVEWLVADGVRWVAMGKMPTTDGNGDLTERGKLLTRPKKSA